MLMASMISSYSICFETRDNPGILQDDRVDILQNENEYGLRRKDELRDETCKISNIIELFNLRYERSTDSNVSYINDNPR